MCHNVLFLQSDNDVAKKLLLLLSMVLFPPRDSNSDSDIAIMDVGPIS